MTFCCWYVILCPTRKCRNFSLMSADISNIFLELFQRQTTERQMRSKCNLLYPTNVICLTLNGVTARQVRSGQLYRSRLRVFDLGGDRSEPLPFGAQQPGNLSPPTTINSIKKRESLFMRLQGNSIPGHRKVAPLCLANPTG